MVHSRTEKRRDDILAQTLHSQVRAVDWSSSRILDEISSAHIHRHYKHDKVLCLQGHVTDKLTNSAEHALSAFARWRYQSFFAFFGLVVVTLPQFGPTLNNVIAVLIGYSESFIKTA